MKILHTVAHYYPSIGGMQEVVRQISERLVQMGHDVTVATSAMPERGGGSIRGVQISEFEIQGNAAKGYKGEVGRYRDFLLRKNFDVITNFAAQQWATDLMLPLLDQIENRKVFVPTGFSGLYSPVYRKYFQQMGKVMKLYDMCVFLSEDYRDIRFARDHNIDKRCLIPNGAAADEFLPEPQIDIRQRLGIPPDHFLLLSVGSHTGIKGHAEAIRIFGSANISNATFLIIGNEYWNGCGKSCKLKQFYLNRLPRWRKLGKRLLTLSLSRSETVAAYHQADMFLFTSNVECSPIVLFECMASKTPFLSADVGNAREIVGWSRAGMLLPTTTTKNGYSKVCIEGSCRLLEKVLAEPSMRNDMKQSGFYAWQEKFTWERIATEYESLYRRLLMGRVIHE